MRALLSWLQAITTLDLRSLGVFRIGLGLVLLVDVVTRSRDADLFYSDLGMRPRSVMLDAMSTAPRPSLQLLSGAPGFQLLLLAVAGVVAICVALGWHTRIAIALAWLLTLSVQNRNGYILSGADSVLLFLCLYGCFLPLGARFSLDARRRQRGGERLPATGATVDVTTAPIALALVVQLVVIYIFNVVNKSGDTWFAGTAVLQALHIDQHTTPLGHLVREHMRFLSPPLTWGTLVVESGAALLLWPWRAPLIRLALVVAMWGLHLGLAACMYLGLFSPVCMVAWLAVLPTMAWARRPLRAVEAQLGRIEGGVERRSEPDDAVAPSPPQRRGAAWAAAVVVVAVALGVQLWLNVAKVLERPVPRPVSIAARAVGLSQLWRMFSVNPSRHDGWFVIEGELESGAVVDAWHDGAPVSWDKPRYVAHLYPTARWRSFMMQNSKQEERKTRERFAGWLCRRYNAAHLDDQMVRVRMTFNLETTRRDFGLHPEIVKEDMGSFACTAPAPTGDVDDDQAKPDED